MRWPQVRALRVLVVLLGASLSLSCGSGPAPGTLASQEAEGAARTSDPAPRIVRVARPALVDPDPAFPSHLYVEQDVRVTARRTGIVVEVLVDRGDHVRAGQPLALLESDLAARDLEIAEQDLRLAEAEYDQVRSLHQQMVVSAQEFLRAEIEREQALSRRALAKAWLERCTVRAPFDGVVAERWVVLGQRLVEEDGTPLFRIAGRGPLRARVDLPEDRAGSVAAGAEVEIELPGEGRRHPGRAVFVAPAVDPASGTLPVIVETPASGPALRPGAAVRVRFNGQTSSAPTLSVPLEALAGGAPPAGGEATLLVAEEGKVRARRVQVVRSDGRSALVRGPVTTGDQVILAPATNLAEGTPVQTREVIR